MTEPKQWTMSEIGPAARLTRERLMLIPEADLIGNAILGAGNGCAHSINLAWDQWAVCTIKCSHGKFRGTSDFLNLTEAVLRAAEKFRKAEHLRYCMADYLATDDDGTTFTTDCGLWIGHDGDHGEPDDDDA